ncbi:MAG: ATP-binding protein [Cellulosilyticum sp.]|nr:ATP-binding protein [Cellulosilyticum sp.]
MLEGKRLRIYVALDIVICIITYAISFSYINKYSFTSVEYVRKYTEVIMAVVVVGLALGIEFYYQIYVLQKQQKENERQRILLEELVEEMNIAKQEAEYENKAKSKFLANMSHEIRTPMNAILGMATLINREEIDYNVRDKVEGIENATRSLLTIVNDILDISKIESGKMEIVEQCYQSSMVIHDVINIIQYKIVDQPIEFEVAISETLPCMLYGDSIRLRQILINLLSNAEKYTNEGKIHFSIDWIEQGQDAQLIIKVQDTGIGIKEADIEKLFMTFERLDVERNHALEGTGLGLTICKQLLDLMQGRICVESQYGEGSTFTVYLKQKIIDKTPIQMMPYKKDKNNYTKDEFIAPEVKV